MPEQQPSIQAHFVLDDQGKPTELAPGHYGIRLSIKGAPADAYAVTYHLHPTYYDPVRESNDAANSFSQEITSYGNFDVTAKIRTKSGPSLLRRSLYDALCESHDRDSKVQQALQGIRAN
jgi:hypothetical protein